MNTELVRVGDVEFFVEILDVEGPQTVRASTARSFGGIRDTILAIGSELSAVWEQLKPGEATVEFSLSATAKTGKLTGLVVDGAASGALKVTLTWKNSSSPRSNEIERDESQRDSSGSLD